FRGHVGPDDNIQGSHTDIRPKEEIAMWMDKDPIKKFEQYLKENQLLDKDRLQVIKDEVMAEVLEAQAFAKN
ncbi:MAG: pyruvate dehydrogenase (acetyl-transferring) E1 component subunit alpha, partial [Syntrophobacteraceae bacterium CG23_combo_of_CG06-09_8_20_14_all_50_8]